MRTRRSVFTFGMVLAGLVLLAAPAVAQDVTDEVMAAQVTGKFTQLKLTWEYVGLPSVVEEMDDLGFYVYYIKAAKKAEMATVAEKTAAMARLNSLAELAGAMKVDAALPGKRVPGKPDPDTSAGTTDFEYELTGLDAGTLYAVTAIAYDGALKAHDGTLGESEDDAQAIPEAAAEQTSAAPKPRRVRGVTLTSGDKMLTVAWDAPTSAGSTKLMIDGYQVQWRLSQTADEQVGDWEKYPSNTDFTKTPDMLDMTAYEIADLVNGVSYDVQVRTVNDAKAKSLWGPDEPGIRGTPSADGATPTPALPLFGILGLGAGLVAAGRRRLRRRQQLLS
jgi:hypothetical protein